MPVSELLPLLVSRPSGLLTMDDVVQSVTTSLCPVANLMSIFLAFRSSFILSVCPCFWLSASVSFAFDVAMQHFSWQSVGVHSFHVQVKSEVFPHSLPSVGPGADPGVQAVSPQVT